MRRHTPNFIYIPFVFSIAGFSWALLIGSLLLFAAIILAPSVKTVRDAEMQRNDLQATVDLLDQKIKMQKEFVETATNDPLVMERLATLQLRMQRKDQEILQLDPGAMQDPSITNLLAASLKPVEAQRVAPIPWYLDAPLNPRLRPFLMVLACLGLVASFVIGVRYER